ncbi:MAG TPA: hypothetical protein VLS93_06660, partial [Anaeromyxobacteraceae bacterium]|nr:hypothetical protein [Anaeromyxobacteraceae bacterium]
MLSPRALLLASVLAACAAPPRAARDHRPLPPPARESRAGARDPGAGPAPGSGAPARGEPREETVRRAIETAASLVGRRSIEAGGVPFGSDCA